MRGRIATAVALAAGALAFAAAPALASTGAFDRAWGKDVGGAGIDTCTIRVSCTAGVAGSADGQFDTAQGIAADSAGNVYVVDTDNQRVEKFDSSGNFVLKWGTGTVGGAGGELNQARDVAVGAAGNVYVADTSNQRIQEFTPSGGFVRTWGANVGPGGAFTCTSAAGCTAGTSGSDDASFNLPTGIGTDPSGNVYVADQNNNRIMEFTSSGTFVRTWGKSVGGAGINTCVVSCGTGTAGAAGTDMNAPNDVAVDSAGRAYVTDLNNERIDEFDVSGPPASVPFVRDWGKNVMGVGNDMCTVAANCSAGNTGTKGGQFDGAQFVTADSNDGVYTGELANNRVQRFDSSGDFLRAWGKDVDPTKPGVFGVCTVAAACAAGTSGAVGGEINGAYGVAIGPGGALYVADLFNQRVQKFVLGVPKAASVTPPSPANQNAPLVHGAGEPGTTVLLYGNGSCTGATLGSGADAAFASPGIAATVPDDSITTFFAATKDEAGQVSACAATSLTYVEDSTAPDTLLDSPPAATITDNSPKIAFHATEANSSFACSFDSQTPVHCTSPAAPPAPLPDGPHTFDVTATDQAGNTDPTPAHAAFMVSAAVTPPLPAPVEGKTVNAIPDSGKVLVKLPKRKGSKAHGAAVTGFVPLETVGRQLPVGTTFDTSHGKVHLFAAKDKRGTLQDGHVNGGLFVLGQARKNPLTTLSMTGGGLGSCGRIPRGGSPKVRAAKARKRHLFSSVHGHFRTRGRNSVATVRGTVWSMTDTCAGTLTAVARGTVVVDDLVKHRTVTLTAGHHYLARSLRKH
jgi:sugar lactone lactonase YvrE